MIVYTHTSTIFLLAWLPFSYHIPLLFMVVILTFELSQDCHLVAAYESVKLSGRSVFVYKYSVEVQYKWICFHGGFNRLNLEEDTCRNSGHMCCSVGFTWAKFRAACWDWEMKARRERVKNGLCGGGGEGVQSREGVYVGWNDKDCPGLARGQQNAGQLPHICLPYEKWRHYWENRDRQDFMTHTVFMVRCFPVRKMEILKEQCIEIL